MRSIHCGSVYALVHLTYLSKNFHLKRVLKQMNHNRLNFLSDLSKTKDLEQSGSANSGLTLDSPVRGYRLTQCHVGELIHGMAAPFSVLPCSSLQ
jgi:hypothetical protein